MRAYRVARLINRHLKPPIEEVDRVWIHLDRRRMRKAGLQFDVLQTIRCRRPIVVIADQDQHIACRLTEDLFRLAAHLEKAARIVGDHRLKGTTTAIGRRAACEGREQRRAAAPREADDPDMVGLNGRQRP